MSKQDVDDLTEIWLEKDSAKTHVKFLRLKDILATHECIAQVPTAVRTSVGKSKVTPLAAPITSADWKRTEGLVNFCIEAITFRSFMSAAVKVNPNKNTLVIENNILFEVTQSTVHMTATDNSCELRQSVCKWTDGDVRFLLPIQAMKTLTEDAVGLISFSVNPENYLTHVYINGREKIDVVGMNAEDYPQMATREAETCDDVTIDSSILYELLKFAGKNEPYKQILECVQIKDGEIFATNGMVMKLSGSKFFNKVNGAIPRHAIEILNSLKVTGSVDIGFPITRDNPVENIARICSITAEHGISITWSEVEGKILNPRQVIPTTHKFNAVVNRAEFIKGMDVAKRMAKKVKIGNRQQYRIDFLFDASKLTISGTNDELGKAEHTLDATVMGATPMHLRFNYEFIKLCVDAMTKDSMIISWDDDSTPVRITEEDDSNVVVLMQVKLEKDE